MLTPDPPQPTRLCLCVWFMNKHSKRVRAKRIGNSSKITDEMTSYQTRVSCKQKQSQIDWYLQLCSEQHETHLTASIYFLLVSFSLSAGNAITIIVIINNINMTFSNSESILSLLILSHLLLHCCVFCSYRLSDHFTWRWFDTTINTKQSTTNWVDINFA